jgi:AbrB family looped-hinge helix DNA binding protein
MRTTIDEAGRLVIPKRVRDAAQLAPGAPLEVRWRDGRIEIEPAPLSVRLERRGRFVIAVPDEPVETPLEEDAVERTRRDIEREHGSR